MSGRYAPLANPRSAPDAEREMEDAFDLDDDENDEETAHESTRLTNDNVDAEASRVESTSKVETSAIPGTYDFEREYDFPPPGSPPRPSSRALPNDYGNSNGLLPTDPVDIPKPKQSIFRRAFGAILPTHYQPVPTSSSTRIGGGIENDGVFANVTAKPQAARVVRTDDGDIHLVPEDNQKESPPSYLEAQQDTVPPYWETTVHAPAGLDGTGDMIIDDLPTGSFLVFCLNIFISFFFQFIGFLLTYLLHTSHAAKFGSRAGLGLTLIQYGFYSRTMNFNEDSNRTDPSAGDGWDSPPAAPVPSDSVSDTSSTVQPEVLSATSKDWLSFLFMTLGWFLLLSSIIGYWRVKRWEKSIRAPVTPPSAEQVEHDAAVRRGLENIFGISIGGPPGQQQHQPTIIHGDEFGNTIVIPSQSALEDARLQRNLRAAGIL
ncbi:Metal homeostatis protein BSD2 [Psilocybe cubensis]|uniref:Metal homeostatis protein BSD2 n=2 Tax=Psilocybe cubensis TaxID=181762 RepID=A0ACB8H2H4_PSICU|nr:Metal homeostatis protein BSD2 [Psilocybe cubensis]KAH9481429.1 Metal homeostatis protein BSD2 [Psilocybe cubensis]